jgi:hypothetical protein
MASVPDLAEIEATVSRMEARYRDDPLFPVCQRLCQRFEADLNERRDLALAKASALMLVKFVDEEPK